MVLDQGIASNILKFADDTKIFKEVRDNTDSEALQSDLDNCGLRNGKWNLMLKSVKLCILGDRLTVVSIT